MNGQRPSASLGRRWARLAVLGCCVASAGQGAIPCFVDSANLGGGVYRYTFRRGDDIGVWGLSPGAGLIQLPSHGVLEVHDPTNWNHSISPSGLIEWTVTNGTVFLDEPVTFTVRSCLTESATYSYTSAGTHSGIYAAAYALPERVVVLAGGAQLFDFVGPVPPRLRIERGSAAVVVRWPAEAQGLQLESTGQLRASPVWTPVAQVPARVGTNWVVNLPATDSARFFRLVTPCGEGE